MTQCDIHNNGYKLFILWGQQKVGKSVHIYFQFISAFQIIIKSIGLVVNSEPVGRFCQLGSGTPFLYKLVCKKGYQVTSITEQKYWDTDSGSGLAESLYCLRITFNSLNIPSLVISKNMILTSLFISGWSLEMLSLSVIIIMNCNKKNIRPHLLFPESICMYMYMPTGCHILQQASFMKSFQSCWYILPCPGLRVLNVHETQQQLLFTFCLISYYNLRKHLFPQREPKSTQECYWLSPLPPYLICQALTKPSFLWCNHNSIFEWPANRLLLLVTPLARCQCNIVLGPSAYQNAGT